MHILESTLKLEHLIVYSSLCNQFIMIPSFDDFSSLDHDDVIRLLYGLKSMCDDDYSAADEELIERFGDLLFTERVKCRSRLIEENDLRIFQEYLRDCKSLFLSS